MILFYDLFSDLKGKKAATSFFEQIINLLSIWKKWKPLDDTFLEGLEISFLNKKRKIDEIPKSVTKNLEIYEDQLLELHSENEENFINLAKKHGISIKGDSASIISKLVRLKEYSLISELEKVYIFNELV